MFLVIGIIGVLIVPPSLSQGKLPWNFAVLEKFRSELYCE